MILLHGITSRLVFLSVVALLSVSFSVCFSYFLSMREIKTIMETDVGTVADVMEKNLNYLARIKPDAYKDENFKKSIYEMKIGKSGYVFMLDENGTLVVHKKDEGKNLAGQRHIDYIRSHKEAGLCEYTAKTTGQRKIAAFRYIKPWKLWIVPGVNKEDYFDQLKYLFLKWNLLFGVGISCLLTVISYKIIRGINGPVKEAARSAIRLASGDFAADIFVNGKTGTERGLSRPVKEIAELKDALHGMKENLRLMVRNVSEASNGTYRISNDLSDASNKVIESARIQSEAVNSTSAAMLQIGTSIKGVAENVKGVSLSASESASSVIEMASNMEEMTRLMEILAALVNDVSSSIIEMSVSIKQVGENVGSLRDASAVTASSVAEMDGSIRQVETNATLTASIVDEVRNDALTGNQAVQAVIEGMHEIKQSSAITSDVIHSLSDRANAIGGILSVIGEVADQTNLLALNAAIIAAQAGEHGKGFAVVADEIKKLAGLTGGYTREIDSLVKGVQDETRRAVAAICKVETCIIDGESLSHKSGEALTKIVSGAERASMQMGQIKCSTIEQGKGSRAVRAAMEHVDDMVSQIAKATVEQLTGSELIIGNVARMKELADHARNSVSEQNTAAAMISDNTEAITDIILHINRACDEQRRGSEQITVSVENIQGAAAVNLEATRLMNESLLKLNEQTEVLRNEMNAFTI